MKFRKDDGSFDVQAFKKAVRLFIIARKSWSTTAVTPTSLLRSTVIGSGRSDWALPTSAR